MKKNLWIQLIVFVLAALLIYKLANLFSFYGERRVVISYSHFKERLEQAQVEQITMKGEEIRGTFIEPLSLVQDSEGRLHRGVQYFLTYHPPLPDRSLLPSLEEQSVIVTIEPSSESSWFVIIASNALPFLILVALWVYLGWRMRGGEGSSFFSVGHTRAKRYVENESKVTFADVAGMEQTKKEVQEVVDFLQDPERFKRLGAKIPKGLLLMGSPGTGKTLLAKAVAGEANVPFFSSSGSEFVEMFVGVGAARVRDLFEKARKKAPSIIFLDEIDAVGRARGAGLGGGHDEREQTLNQLLAEMDGFEPYEGVIVIGATNRPDILDQALLRPGRFDRRIVISQPQLKARRKILELHSRNKPLADDVDLEVIARGTPGLSGADLENLVNEAAIYATREGLEAITRRHFDQALDKVLMGEKRKDLMVEGEKEVIAYHEAGHAIVAHLLPEADPIHKVSIIPRGRSLGITQLLPKDERHSYPRAYLEAKIALALGGRASEELFLHDVSTGAQNDFRQVTELARRMVCRWGLSDRIGVMSIQEDGENIFLGKEIGQDRNISDNTAALVDREVKKILDRCYQRAKDLLLQHKDLLLSLVEKLLEKEVLEKKDLEALFAQGGLA